MPLLRERSAGVVKLLVLLLLAAIGCGDLEEGTAVPGCAPPPPECAYYPEAGDAYTFCVGDTGAITMHGAQRCVLGKNRNDTKGLPCVAYCTAETTSCQITRDNVWVVADCGACAP